MTAPKKKSNSYGWIVLLSILLVAALTAIWYFKVIRPSAELASVNAVIEFKAIDKKVISELKALRACGNWPLNAVSPSTNRGNPFVRKNLDVPPMVASSTPECLPISQ